MASSACSNVDTKGYLMCNNLGTKACANCLLVAYCDTGCQKAHWPIHKKDCKTALAKETWMPAWVTERRPPKFVREIGEPEQVHFGNGSYLWGNVPAVDVVQLERNEGNSYQGPLNLLFAASGDLRNVIMSVGHLPMAFTAPVNIVINDRNMEVVARNVILLLLFLVVDDAQDATKHALHVFYSAFITEECYDILQTRIRPLVETVCNKIASKPPTAFLGKTWNFSGRHLRLELFKKDWFLLLSFFDVPAGLTNASAQKVRDKIVAAPERIDYVHRRLVRQVPARRPSLVKFRADGLLLPFGASRVSFTIPNPTIFQSAGEWPMMDNADPLDGWDRNDVQGFDACTAKNDLYGKLYHYLIGVFEGFHKQLSQRPVFMQINQVDARNIGAYTDKKFARIETSNIADGGYIGTGQALRTFGPLLQRPSDNPHATLVLLYLNAVAETMAMTKMKYDHDEMSKSMATVMKYMPILAPLRATNHTSTGQLPSPDEMNVRMIKINSAIDLVQDFDAAFSLYVAIHRLPELCVETGMIMKQEHTILDKWPLRFKFGPVNAQTKRDFEVLLASGDIGHERYTEWKVTDMTDIMNVAGMIG